MQWILAGLTLAVLLTSPALAGAKKKAEEQPVIVIQELRTGFRGLLWGAEQDDLEDTLGLDDCRQVDPLVTNCLARKAELAIEGIPLLTVRYKFANERFCGIALKFKTSESDRMLALAMRLLGQPTSYKEMIPQWEDSEIVAWCSDIHLSIVSKKTVSEAAAAK